MNKDQRVQNLISEREKLLTLKELYNIKRKQISEADFKVFLEKEFQKDISRLDEIEKLLTKIGFILAERGGAEMYRQINNQICNLETSKDLTNWIIEKIPIDKKEYYNGIGIFNSKSELKLGGKWIGNMKSMNGFFPGEFCIGICQIENKIIGFGALTQGMYSSIFINGLADNDEIRIEAYNEQNTIKTFLSGQISRKDDCIAINGKYFVADGFDWGYIKSSIESGLIKISPQNKKLSLLARTRNIIAEGKKDNLTKVLDQLGVEFNETYKNEIVLHKNRINRINENQRLGLISFSESNYEEMRVINDILNMISEIEVKLKNEI